MAPENIQLAEAAAMDQQYEQHGLLQTTSGSIMILAGAGVGGGTAINWSCCLPLPDYVREEWVALHGLQAFASAEYETSLQHVLATMGASEPSKMTHNAMNVKLQKGCDALEYKWETTGQVCSILLCTSDGISFILRL
jgi:long-chain-alcohol oxidase